MFGSLWIWIFGLESGVRVGGGTPLGASSRHAIAIARFGTFSTQKNYFGKDGGPMTPPEQGVSGLRGFGATGP